MVSCLPDAGDPVPIFIGRSAGRCCEQMARWTFRKMLRATYDGNGCRFLSLMVVHPVLWLQQLLADPSLAHREDSNG